MKKSLNAAKYSVLTVATVLTLNLCTTEAEESMAQNINETRIIDYPQGKVAYHVSGSGSPIILLHGAGASAQANWGATVPLLEKTRRVININLVGAGTTTFQKDELVVGDLVDLIIAVANAEGAEQFDVVGYSTGAVAGLALATLHPKRVKQLVAMAPWANDDARTRSFFRLWERIYQVDPNLFAHFNTHLALSESAQLQMNEEALVGAIRNFENTGFNNDLGKVIDLLQRVNLEDELEKISAKTLIIGFEDDRIVPPAYARAVAEGISGAGYTTLAAGHGGPWEATEAMNTEISKFLQ